MRREQRQVVRKTVSPPLRDGEAGRAAGPQAQDGPVLLRSILIIDDQASFVAGLAHGFGAAKLEVSSVSSLDEAAAAIEICRPSHIISELRVGKDSLLRSLPELTRSCSIGRFVIATAYPSVASAVRFARMGVAAYMAKPVSFEVVLDALKGGQDPPEPDELVWPTLDRTIWEYLSQVHLLAGSISEAARRIGLDPRSLRRMLAKYPPPR